jgi:iron complex outermembrane receptor protein
VLHVKDKASGQLLSATSVSIEGKSFMANDSGQIVIERNSYKNFHAVFSHVGYANLGAHFFPKDSLETDTVFLTPGAGTLQQVTVTGYVAITA